MSISKFLNKRVTLFDRDVAVKHLLLAVAGLILFVLVLAVLARC